MRKGQFDLSDLREQLIGMQQMGGMAGLMGMMPGIAKMKNQLAAANLDERVLKRQMAIIDSMTPKERKTPDVLKASRKKRIAAGSGTKVEDVNRMLKMHRQMADVMKAMSGGPKRGPMAGLANMLGFGGGGGGMPSPEQMQELAKRMPGGAAGLPGGVPSSGGLPPTMPGLPPKFPGGPMLPGLGGGKLPGLGGFPGVGKKK
jgi:signal recognition particle subunit SRP54